MDKLEHPQILPIAHESDLLQLFTSQKARYIDFFVLEPLVNFKLMNLLTFYKRAPVSFLALLALFLEEL